MTSTDATAPGTTPRQVNTPKLVSAPLDWMDQRIPLANGAKKFLRKVFPDHWSFLLGEIALFSFIILLLTGTFLSLWFKPSMQEVVYSGGYTPLAGVHMSEAFASTLDISFNVRGGLLMRQIHHWAATLFVAAMTIHMLRTFFTGAFRKPRELNWLLGTILLQLGLIEGFTGYSLPDDLLSGTGLRFVEGLIRSVPVVGTYLSFWIFGGEFPGDTLIPRLYPVHILLIPGIILALIAVHIGLVVLQKHSQYAGAGKTNKNVVGPPFFPNYVTKQGGFFFIVFGATALMGTLMQINPVWVYGPYTSTQVGAGTQPDWYMGWVEGGLRIMPNWETHLFGFTISWNIMIPGLGLLGLLAVVLGLYPFIEQWVTGDKREHHILDRPRDAATRTAFGVAGITFYGLLWVGGGNDIIATQFHVAINVVTWVLRFAIFLGPVAAFMITKRICLSLQRKDHEEVVHGRETGIVMRLPSGEFIEVHEPLSPEGAYDLTAKERREVLPPEPAVDENGVPEPGGPLRKVRGKASGFYFGDSVHKPTTEELEEAGNGHGNGHGELEAGSNGHSELTSTGSTDKSSH